MSSHGNPLALLSGDPLGYKTQSRRVEETDFVGGIRPNSFFVSVKTLPELWFS
jgi:hypothetical protein